MSLDSGRSFDRVRAAVSRLGETLAHVDPAVRADERDRDDAFRDVERRRLDAAHHAARHWDDRTALP
jgi:hypothetical protein